MADMKAIADALFKGDRDAVVKMTKGALEAGTDPLVGLPERQALVDHEAERVFRRVQLLLHADVFLDEGDFRQGMGEDAQRLPGEEKVDAAFFKAAMISR